MDLTQKLLKELTEAHGIPGYETANTFSLWEPYRKIGRAV